MDMHPTLNRDQFFGLRITAQSVGKFSLSLTRYDRGTAIPWHAHDEPYATVVVSGAYREETSAGIRDCRERDVIVHAPAERHSDSFNHGNATCLNVHGTPFDRSALLPRSQVGEVAGKLVEEFRRPDALSSMAIEALMVELFVAAARHDDAPCRPLWLTEVRRTVEERFQESLSLGYLAETVGVHPGHVARTFRQQYGTTIGGRVRELRVAYVKQRLASAAPLRDIAVDAGFADQSHLTRTFRRSTGVTPAAFRRLLR